MKALRRVLAPLAAFAVVAALLLVAVAEKHQRRGPRYEEKVRVHLDHAGYFKGVSFSSGVEVTEACLQCHEKEGRQLIHSTHWTWLGDKIQRPGMREPLPIGKKNLINNFCIGVQGNWPSCTKCHAGYGWKDESFDFKDARHVDCLVCHDWSGQYVKDKAGEPAPGVDLAASAASVGWPKRQNCSTCHSYGGGGLGVKHGDLDNSLENPAASLDVHMGGQGLLCIDCHRAVDHKIPGRSFAVSVNKEGGIGCTDCHQGLRHQDPRVEKHFSAVACQTCHIPSFARRVPTKKTWDWSKAGNAARKEDPHHYLKIKGEFTYEQDAVPEYAWFKGRVDRYLAGDRIAEHGPTHLNRPQGGINDPEAKIWPFKVHRAKQPYDAVHRTLIVPVTAGTGKDTELGYWTKFDWQEAARLSVKYTGLPYSGKLAFTDTEMAWPLSHMVAPKDQALRCVDCHGPSGRLDWRALGYAGDPAETGGRKP